MPSAGEEGYEKMVICPYDRAHEVRVGKMQFHLEKCRKNYPNAELSECLFNKTHIVPTVELEFHHNEDCVSRLLWDRHTFNVGNTNCPVENLVPVNAASVPDGEENWDDFETQGSVLNTIKTQAAEKDILRLKQCESKAKRKSFRQEERLRHEHLKDSPYTGTSSASSVVSGSEPLRKPKKPISLPVERQDPADFMATLNQQFRSIDLNMKNKDQAPSETSSVYNEPPSVTPSIGPSATPPIAPSVAPSKPPSVASSMTPSITPSMTPSITPSIAESATTSQGRSYAMMAGPSTSFSSALSTSSRMSTAASIAASVSRASAAGMPPDTSNEDGFSQIPIPGLGRGRRKKANY